MTAVWELGHSDAFHPDGREGCEHCQEMIAAFGEMPPVETIRAMQAPTRRDLKTAIPDSLRWGIWERDDFTCQHCGTRRYLSVDHVTPEIKGGTTTADNLQTLCRRCNSSKGAR